LFSALGDPNQSVFFAGMGMVSGLVFANMGAAYGTAKSGVGICSVAVMKPELIFKSIIPVVMSGILGIYGLIIAVLLTIKLKPVPYTDDALGVPSTWTINYYSCYRYLSAGLCCGLSCLASGLCIGVVGDAGVRGNAQRDIMIAIVLMMIFAEALALYGFITAVILASG
jgi:V-type H+-transporting ATPase proteolipid subunit